ncbi:MAG: aspartate kinase [Verrucomicrobia bacterium]|nr:aspartate kinase [Verrucomicrobiota bacterium]
MALVVQKYGGTSVGNPDRIKNVARRVLATQQAGNQVVVVVSAMSGVTDNLIKLAREVHDMPNEREMDMLLATGEQTTIALLAMALHALGAKATSLTGAQAGIVTDRVHTKAKIANITPKRVHELLNDGNVVIVAGFQGETPDNQITTLGRGGSDLSAIAIAAALKADICQIYTDVDGVYTADPRIVKNAQKIPEISYDEMLEMAALGSKVMQARSVEFAKKFKVVFEVRSSFNDNPGTIVKEETRNMEDMVIRGVAVDKKQAKVTVAHVPDKPGMASRIFRAVADANINVDVIVQNVSEKGSTDITFTVGTDDLKKSLVALEKVAKEVGASGVTAQDGIAKVSIIGVGMRSHPGVAAEMFEALAANHINIGMISTSEIKISVVIDLKDADKADNVLHEKFGLAKK